MNWRRVSETLLAIVAVGAIGTSTFAATDKEVFKEAMRKALDGLRPMLIGLVKGDYESVLHEVEPIVEHASKLPEMIPDDAKEHQDDFLAYAYNLRENAKILKSLIETIVRNDKAASDRPEMRTDYLSVVAATHFGGMVNMCVACHSRFRIPIEP
jgi:cytochrome c556